MSRIKDISQNVNEAEDVEVKFITSVDTSGKTISFIYQINDGSSMPVVAGTTSGDKSNTALAITANLSGLSPNTYKYWLYSDYGGGSQRLLYPENDEIAKFQVIERT